MHFIHRVPLNTRQCFIQYKYTRRRVLEAVSGKAHNLEVGGSIPSSATKFGAYFMIAIDVTMTYNWNSPSWRKISDFESGEDYIYSIIRESYHKIYNFFQTCVEQNLVINATMCISDLETRYFATTIEDAQAFQSAFTDMSADFSMKKMWTENGFDISIEQHEVNFDDEFDVIELINPIGQIWGTDF